jgi:hypothetical protein
VGFLANFAARDEKFVELQAKTVYSEVVGLVIGAGQAVY